MAHKAVAQIIFNKNNKGHFQYPDPKKTYEDLKYLVECMELVIPDLDPITVQCCMCEAQAEFEDLDQAYCNGWYGNDCLHYCSEHAQAGIDEEDERWESRMK